MVTFSKTHKRTQQLHSWTGLRLTNGEKIGPTEKLDQFFICNQCSQRVEATKHSMQCEECNQVLAFMDDIESAVHQVVSDARVSNNVKERLTTMSTRLLRNIELFQGHVARNKAQQRFWSDTLQRLEDNDIYDEGTCMSDFWRCVTPSLVLTLHLLTLHPDPSPEPPPSHSP